MIEGDLSFRPDRFGTSTIVLLEVANVVAHFRSPVAGLMLKNGHHSCRELWEHYVTLVVEFEDSLLFRLMMFSSFGSNLIRKPRTKSQKGAEMR